MTAIDYRSIKKYKYQLLTTYTHATDLRPRLALTTHNGWVKLDKLGNLTINKGYAWDGPSGPTIDTENFMRGSLVHDALYQLMREGQLYRKYREFADQLLRTICIEDGMSWIRAWYVYKSVRMFAEKAVKPQRR